MPEVMGPLLGPWLLCRVHADRLGRGSRLAGIVWNRDSCPSWERYVGFPDKWLRLPLAAEHPQAFRALADPRAEAQGSSGLPPAPKPS